MEKVDRLDKKILGILSQNARMPLKMLLPSVAFHVLLFTSAYNIS